MVGPAGRDAMNLLAKVMYFLKKFLPSGTHINSAPPAVPEGPFREWNENIEILARSAGAAALLFLQQEFDLMFTSGMIDKKVNVTDSVSANNKRFNDITEKAIEFPSPVVTDTATDAKYNITEYVLKVRGKRPRVESNM